MTSAPVTTPTSVSSGTLSVLTWRISSWPGWDNRAEEEVNWGTTVTASSVVVVGGGVVVVVGRHSGATGSPGEDYCSKEFSDQSDVSPSNLLQLMTRWDPSEVDTALIALTLIWLLITSTILVLDTITELEYILRKMQSLIMTLLVVSTITLCGGRWLKVEESSRNVLTLSTLI